MMIPYLLTVSLAAGFVPGAVSRSIDHVQQKTAAGARTAATRTVEIVATDEMQFSVTKITAKAGERLRIRLQTQGQMRKAIMSHNLVVLKKGVDSAAFNAAALTARASDFIPSGRQGDVIAATKLAGAGETVEATFTVPSEAGDYEFICTFPGHYAAGMRGVLIVR